MSLPKLRAIYRFYGQIFIFSNAVTVGLLFAVWPEKPGHLGQSVVFFVWENSSRMHPPGICTAVLIKRAHNLGLSERALYGGAFGLDLAIGLGLMAILSLFA